MIAIIDYGMGNLHSVYNALKQMKCECIITSQKEDLISADGLLLPGVGAFYDCMENLKKSGLIDTMKNECAKGKPLLGICLGMQVLFEKGHEVKTCDGLGLLQGEIQLMEDAQVKIPHIGWNRLEIVKEDPLLSMFDHLPFVYFVHSYCACHYDSQDLIAYTNYGSLKIPAYVRKGNIFGMQYHPEKSGEDGLKMLEQFVNVCTQTKGKE
ncbi:MAG: imidazole glycerol phosphate synthase subunit HisH [Erysipelotrichia bacterium]|nr:imidazole glycerol phosphate synthase subunit HisH [Erysipelotrichia bacterium]NCC54315.1 imidazole glycerol phosphate synthase subunit HisH [Erysipelotrichia bacterium]